MKTWMEQFCPLRIIILNCVINLQPVLQHSPQYLVAVQSMNEMIQQLNCIEEQKERNLRSRGRPAIVITVSELRNLLELQFTQAEIGRLFCCSPRTVRRRMLQYGLEALTHLTDFSDRLLDDMVAHFVASFPTAGQKTVEGHLISQGYRIQRWRIRDSLLRVDPWGVQQRSRRVLRRRRYSVLGPNSLWHIDGFHKLIRWRIIIVIHGGIDGFSDIPVYLHASDNNKADVVLQSFLQAVRSYGLPSRVRADFGGENTLVSYIPVHAEASTSWSRPWKFYHRKKRPQSEN